MGHWDEHLAIQTFLNEIVVDLQIPGLNEDLLAFLLGVAQHELYDLVVNERPIQLQRIDFRQVNTLKQEMPSLFTNVVGIGIALWRTLKRYSEDQDKVKLRRRLLGLLGAITPDLLEGLRLVLLPDGKDVWNKGDAEQFHFSIADWQHPIDTTKDKEKDMQRRWLMQELTLSFEFFRIEF